MSRRRASPSPRAAAKPWHHTTPFPVDCQSRRGGEWKRWSEEPVSCVLDSWQRKSPDCAELVESSSLRENGQWSFFNIFHYYCASSFSDTYLSLWTSLQSRWFSAHFSATCLHLSNMQATVAEVMELDCTQLEFVSFKWSVNWSELCTIGTVFPISISQDEWCSQYLWINCVPYNSIMWNISIYLPNKVLMNTRVSQITPYTLFTWEKGPK